MTQPPFWAKLLKNAPRTQAGRQDRILNVLSHYKAFMTVSTIAEHTGDAAHAIEIEMANLVEYEAVVVEMFKRGVNIRACNAYKIA